MLTVEAAGVQRTLMKTTCQRELDFYGHVARSNGLANLVLSGKISKGRRKARGRQRLKYLDDLYTCWKDNVSPTQLIMAAEDKMLWHHMVADFVNDDTATQKENRLSYRNRSIVIFCHFCGVLKRTRDKVQITELPGKVFIQENQTST